MDRRSAALLELCSRHRLDEVQRGALEAIVDLLAADARAPSGVTDPELAVGVHVADSLAALDLDVVRGATAVVDIGAGAGFPGLPLAVALPECGFTLLESQHRKCRYLERAILAAGLENTRVVCGRAEAWPTGIEAHDLAVVRALAAQPVVLEYAAPLLRVDGALVDWRGRRDPDEESAAMRAASQLGLERVAIEPVRPYPAVRDHHLHVYVKARQTPPRFPRRVGVARKRPLGSSV